jgi:hypothetical protein
MQDVLLLITFVVLVIIPIVPAYVLFKALPSKADMKGPLQGLGLKLSGGFAGYFALLLLTFTQLPRVRQFVSPETHEVWTVEGNLQDPRGNGVLVGPCEVHFMPDPYGSFPSGWFKTTFVTSLSEGATADFPHLSIAHSGFPPLDIPLDPKALEEHNLEQTLDLPAHTIVLKPIVLKDPSTPYVPTASSQPAPIDTNTYLKAIQGSGRSSNGNN